MTSKSGSTRVATSKFLTIAQKAGLTVETKAGWLLMFNPGFKKARLLVHTGKKGTNCIELVSFESPFAIAHPVPPAKTMTQMLDCNIDEKLILRNFYKTVKALVALAPKSVTPTETEIQNDSPAVKNESASSVESAPAEEPAKEQQTFEQILASVG